MKMACDQAASEWGRFQFKMSNAQLSALYLLDWTRAREVSCAGSIVVVETEVGERRFEFSSEAEAQRAFETCRYLQLKGSNQKAAKP